MKKIIIIIILISTGLLFAENNIIPQNILSSIENFIDNKTYIKFDIDQNGESIKQEILSYLLLNNKEIVNSDKSKVDSFFIIKISLNETVSNRFHIFKSIKNRRTNYNIEIKKIDSKTDIIDKYKKLNFTIKTTEHDKLSYKWYDPIMISTIIGGLVYLFYFGE